MENLDTDTRLNADLRYIFYDQYYWTRGATVLINDTEQVNYYLQSFSIDEERNWQGIFYVEAYDHYGLDEGILKRIYMVYLNFKI